MEFVEICLMIVGALLLLLAIYLSREQEGENKPPVAEQPDPSFSPEGATKLEKSLTEMVHEVHNLSRNMTEDLDHKLSELKELLEFADIKVEELTQANSDNRGAAEPEGAGEPGEAPAESPTAELQPEEDEEAAPASDRYQQIYAMADEGLSIDEIARGVQMGKGEIQLILSLRKKD